MNLSPLRAICALVFPVLASTGGLQAASVVFQEDFSSSTIVGNGNPYYGGWYSPQVTAGKWNGAYEASITAGELRVNPTSGVRSAGLILDPSNFSAPGQYTLTFDVTSFQVDGGPADDFGLVSVWSGKGYDLTRSSGSALILDTYSAQLKGAEGATAQELGNLKFSDTGSKQITFDYDGTSAVALFFGATTGGWPFPTVKYDNINLTMPTLSMRPGNTPVPEPSVMMLGAVVSVGGCFIRRRK